MANYVKSKYEDDKGVIHPIRLSADSAAQAGAEPAGAVTSNIPAKVSKGNREFGLRPRGVRLYRSVGTAPNLFNKYKFLPLRSQADAADAEYAQEATIAIGGISWKVAAFVAEDYA